MFSVGVFVCLLTKPQDGWYNYSMDIFILRKSITDLKNPIVKTEYVTNAKTVGEFICEMVQKNYAARPVSMPLDECKRIALDEFGDGSYYIINRTKDIKYSDVDQITEMTDGDEIILIKLKYVRGLIW